MFELHCPTCAQPGATSSDRAEVQTFADTHNEMLHRRRPIATVKRRLFTRGGRS